MNERELRVRINCDHAPAGFELLSPGASLRWGRCRFDFNPPSGGQADFSIVLWNARPVDRCEVAPENTLFIAGEPPAKKVYPKGFYRQFGRLVDTHELSGHPQVTVSAPGLCWHVGLDQKSGSYRYGYDHLLALARPEKTDKISVVCSNAATTPGQRLRLAFLARLKERLGGRLVHYGRGFEPIDDKMDAILPHRFHLVLENSEQPHYWTEKLADSYLGWAFPLYVGCPNLSEYFAPESFVHLDPNAADAAADKILRLLESPASLDEQALLAEARLRVLQEYNPFAWCARWAEAWHQDLPTKLITIRSHRAFRPFPRGLIHRLRCRE